MANGAPPFWKRKNWYFTWLLLNRISCNFQKVLHFHLGQEGCDNLQEDVAQVYKQKTTNSISVSFYLISIQLQNTLNDYITCNRGTKKFKRLLYDYITCNPFFTTFSSLPVEILERAGLANI